MEFKDVKPIFIKFDDPSLDIVQKRTLNVIRGEARHESEKAKDRVVLKLGGLEMAERVAEYIQLVAPLVIHFKPTLLEKFVTDTNFRSLFEVGTGGGCTDQKVRAKWESAVFKKLYDGCQKYERPKYGAMNVLNHPSGVRNAISYGDSYLVLKPHVRIRTTVATGDTSSSRTIGVTDYCYHVIDAFSKQELQDLTDIIDNKKPHGESRAPTYREIQIHGSLVFSRDFSKVCIPLKHLETHGETAELFAKNNGIELEWF